MFHEMPSLFIMALSVVLGMPQASSRGTHSTGVLRDTRSMSSRSTSSGVEPSLDSNHPRPVRSPARGPIANSLGLLIVGLRVSLRSTVAALFQKTHVNWSCFGVGGHVVRQGRSAERRTRILPEVMIVVASHYPPYAVLGFEVRPKESSQV